MKLRERTISRTLTVTTCIVSIYEKETRLVSDVTAYVTGYTSAEEIETYLSSQYNGKLYVMLDYTVTRVQVIKATMNEEEFRMNANHWEIISDKEITYPTDEELPLDVGEAVEE